MGRPRCMRHCMRSMWRSMRRFVRRLMGVVWNIIWNAHRCAQTYTCMVIFINMHKIASKLFVTQASSNLEVIFRHHFFTGPCFVSCVQLCMCAESPRKLQRHPKRHKTFSKTASSLAPRNISFPSRKTDASKTF